MGQVFSFMFIQIGTILKVRTLFLKELIQLFFCGFLSFYTLKNDNKGRRKERSERTRKEVFLVALWTVSYYTHIPCCVL
jgi:hypothetical protein